MSINNFDLKQLNAALTNALNDQNADITVAYASRTFKLVDPTTKQPFEVKLKDIVKQYQKLASKSDDTKLISDIHHQITKLDLIGDALLAKQGPGSRFFRDIGNLWKNTFGEGSHLEIIDRIEAQSLKNNVGNETLHKKMSDLFALKSDSPKYNENYERAIQAFTDGLKDSKQNELAKAKLTHTLRLFSNSHPNETYRLIDSLSKESEHQAFLEPFKTRIQARTGTLREEYIKNFTKYEGAHQDASTPPNSHSIQDQLPKPSSPIIAKNEDKIPEKIANQPNPEQPKTVILNPEPIKSEPSKAPEPKVDLPPTPPSNQEVNVNPPVSPISATKTESLSTLPQQLKEICDYLNSLKMPNEPVFSVKKNQIIAKTTIESDEGLFEAQFNLMGGMEAVFKGLQEKGEIVGRQEETGNKKFYEFTISDPSHLKKLHEEVMEAKSKPSETVIAKEEIKPPVKEIKPPEVKVALPSAKAAEQAPAKPLSPLSEPLPQLPKIPQDYVDNWFAISGEKVFSQRMKILEDIVGNKDLSHDQVLELFNRFEIKKDGGWFFYKNSSPNTLYGKMQQERKEVFQKLPLKYSSQMLLENEGKLNGTIVILKNGEHFTGIRIVFESETAKNQHLKQYHLKTPESKAGPNNKMLDLNGDAAYSLLGANSKIPEHVDIFWNYIDQVSLDTDRVIYQLQGSPEVKGSESKIPVVKSQSSIATPLASALLNNDLAKFNELAANGETDCSVFQDGKTTHYSIKAFLEYQTKIEIAPNFKNDRLLRSGGLPKFNPEESVKLTVKSFLNSLDPQHAHQNHFPEIKVDKDHIQINFAPEARELGRMLAANLIQHDMDGFQFWDDTACSFTFKQKDAKIFLETCCNFPPKWVELTFQSEHGTWDDTFRNEMTKTIETYGIKYEVVLSPSKNPQIKFSYDSEKERNEQVEKIRGTLKDKVDNPLNESFQLPPMNAEGKYAILLTSNECYHLLGFVSRVEDPLFKQFLSQNYVENSITSTEAIPHKYTEEASIEDQRIAHDNAKEFLKENLNLIGSSVDFISTTNPNPMVEKIEKDLNPNVFSWEITHGVGEDILKAGQRDDDTVVIFSAASQYNGCEATGRFTIKPGEAVVAYSYDGTQGPEAQLAFSREQVEIINCGGNNKFNGLSNILTENTKSAVKHGYLTPDESNIDEVIENLKAHGGKLEFPVVTSIPNDGTKPVSMILVAAPALGRRYGSRDKPIQDKAKEKEVQYLCALQGFKAQFQSAINASQGGTQKVNLKSTAVGLGVFENDPNVVSKAFYTAAKEYEEQLAKSNVKVQLQVYQGVMPVSDAYSPEYAQAYKRKLEEEMLKSKAYSMVEALF